MEWNFNRGFTDFENMHICAFGCGAFSTDGHKPDCVFLDFKRQLARYANVDRLGNIRSTR